MQLVAIVLEHLVDDALLHAASGLSNPSLLGEDDSSELSSTPYEWVASELLALLHLDHVHLLEDLLHV